MNIAIVEDHSFVAQTLQACLLNRFPDAVIRHFSNGEDLLSSLETPGNEWEPHIIITDLLVKGASGVELMRKYNQLKKTLGSDIKIIVLSSINEANTIRQILQNGANAYLTKEAEVEEMFDAIEKVMRGQTYIMSRLKDSLLSNVLAEDKVNLHLSPQQHAILIEICKGRTIIEAADELKLSVHTARTYLQNIMRKFEVNRTPDLILFAIKNGLFQV